jgi:hypothetical protein
VSTHFYVEESLTFSRSRAPQAVGNVCLVLGSWRCLRGRGVESSGFHEARAIAIAGPTNM